MLQTRQAATWDRLKRSVEELRRTFERFAAESPEFARSLQLPERDED